MASQNCAFPATHCGKFAANQFPVSIRCNNVGQRRQATAGSRLSPEQVFYRQLFQGLPIDLTFECIMKRVALHLLLWTLYAVVEYVANLPHYSDRKELLRQTLFFLPVIALPFYFIAYFLLPRLLWRGQKTLFWLSCGAVFLVVLFIRLQWTHWYWLWQTGRPFDVPLSKISKNLFRDYAVIGFAVALKVIRDWDRKDRLTIQLQGEKRDAELQFLRAQIHPHFLFNTLNNLYGLALKNAPQTPDSILRLSGLLDFILYECNAEKIPVQKEITLIGQYIELERLRFGERLNLVFNADTPPENALVAPLLLLPFVENAFKHGAGSTNGEVFVKIDLRIDGKNLWFQVENSKSPNGKSESNGSKGIGLRNVEKRLQLLYADRYRLHKTESADVFLISLELRL